MLICLTLPFSYPDYGREISFLGEVIVKVHGSIYVTGSLACRFEFNQFDCASDLRVA